MSKAQLLWLDMEMTGLDVAREVPIEIAAVVTDWEFNVLDQYHSVIKQPQKYLDAMDDWNKKHHGESGLIALVPSGKDPSSVDEDLKKLCVQHFDKETRPILAGNSIAQDRMFIRAYLPKLESVLHYRMLDVSAWKVIFNGRYNLKFKKNDGHRALDDIFESINELKFYMEHIRV